MIENLEPFKVTLPTHIAIIMDGNGRWANAHGHHRFFGHVRGARVAKSIIEACSFRQVKFLTLFAFSSENWLRPKDEVNLLMKLLFSRLNRERAGLVRNNIKFKCIGDLERLPAKVKEAVNQTISATDHCTGMTLIFALSYGGRQEIAGAAKKIAFLVGSGQLRPEDVNEELFHSQLESSEIPDPDLIIRTSGESRLSNFYLWQSAYSELMVFPKMWPEFTRNDLDLAIESFNLKERRFGKTSEQLGSTLQASFRSLKGEI